MKYKNCRKKFVLFGVLLLLLLLLFGWKTYLEEKERHIDYDEIYDDSFCMLDLESAEVMTMELSTEIVP